MNKSEPADPTYLRQIIGSLMYLVNTRPDICYATHALSQFMCAPKKIHLHAAKYILRYLKGTIGMGIKYDKVNIELLGYCDCDWAGSSIERKSTSGYCFCLGSGMVSWSSRKQTSFALSSTEAEYIASSLGAREAVWLRKLLSDLFKGHLKPTVIYCDNQSCIKLSVNPVLHDKSKYIEIPYHYVRNMVERNVIQLEYFNTSDHKTNILTKPLSRVKVEHLQNKLGMV